MKKFYQLTIGCIVLCAQVACGGSNNKSEEDKNKSESYTYMDAVNNNDFESAHKMLNELYADFQDAWESNYVGMKPANREIIESAAEKYARAASNILCAEARYIISEYPDEAFDRLSYLFNEIRVMGEKSDQYAPNGDTPYQQECAKVNCYRQTVKYNNELCDVVLNLGLTYNNKKLSELALLFYRENGHPDQTNYTVRWSYDDKETAMEKYREAVNNNYFN